jgi:hypothetical protein
MYGIAISERSVTKILSCTITNCKYGIIFGHGSTNTEINHCVVKSNHIHGVYITDFCSNNLSLVHNNTITMNGLMGICNANEDECSVVVDGSLFLKNISINKSVKQANYLNLLSAAEQDGSEFNLSQQCTFKLLGVTEYAPHCNKCQLKEPKVTNFSKCGLCEAVVYCSKECQANDWTEHKTVCMIKV